MDVRDVQRPIEVLAKAIAGWYYIVGFKFKQNIRVCSVSNFIRSVI